MHPLPSRPRLDALSSLAAETDAAWEAIPPQRQPESSYVGAMPNAETPAQSASRRHRSLAAAIHLVEDECARFDSYDLSAKAAEVSLRKRVGCLALLRSSLGAVANIAAGQDPVEPYLEPYLASVYLWLEGVAGALFKLASQLNATQPDWSGFRQALAEVAWLYQNTVTQQTRIEGRDFSEAPLADALDGLFVDLVLFKTMLNEPFG